MYCGICVPPSAFAFEPYCSRTLAPQMGGWMSAILSPRLQSSVRPRFLESHLLSDSADVLAVYMVPSQSGKQCYISWHLLRYFSLTMTIHLPHIFHQAFSQWLCESPLPQKRCTCEPRGRLEEGTMGCICLKCWVGTAHRTCYTPTCMHSVLKNCETWSKSKLDKNILTSE